MARTATNEQVQPGKIPFPDCISRLDAVLVRFMPRLTGDQIPALRALLFANNEIVMKEMERRGPPEQTTGR